MRRDQAAVIGQGTARIRVRPEPEGDPELNRRIDDAYRLKYGARWPAETDAMVAPEVVRTTLRIIPG